MTQISLTLNGERVDAEVEPRQHLAGFLRNQRNLTATHLRCEQGVCGACTILVDGVPTRSCILYATQCDGAEVVTLEGLRDDPVMASLREAFSAEHGLQCGFCTPGMLVTARDIVTRLPTADEARVTRELAGNLCRCTGYAGIVRAISRVLAERSARGMASEATGTATLGPSGSLRVPMQGEHAATEDDATSYQERAGNHQAAPEGRTPVFAALRRLFRGAGE